jgi:hypothetical protein
MQSPATDLYVSVRGRTASGGWENYRAVDEYRHITAFFLEVTFKIFSSCMIILDACLYWALGPEKMFSKYESSLHVLSMMQSDLQACAWFVHSMAAEALNTR